MNAKEIFSVSPLNHICDVSRKSQKVGQFFDHWNDTGDVIGGNETSLIVVRWKNGWKSFVEEEKWEEDDGSREPVDNVLNHLNESKTSSFNFLSFLIYFRTGMDNSFLAPQAALETSKVSAGQIMYSKAKN